MAYHQLRIARIVQETPDARSFVLEVPEDLADRFKYRAGQFLTFQDEGTRVRTTRAPSTAAIRCRARPRPTAAISR